MHDLAFSVSHQVDLVIRAGSLEHALAFARKYEQKHWSSSHFCSLEQISLATHHLTGGGETWKFTYHVFYAQKGES